MSSKNETNGAYKAILGEYQSSELTDINIP